MRRHHGPRNSTLIALALALMGFSAGAGPMRFLTRAAEGDPLEIAMRYIQSHRQDLGLTEADLAGMLVRDRYVTKHNGVTHIYLQQRLDGIEVWNGQIGVNIASDGSIINVNNGFVGNLAANVNTGSPALSDRAAIERAAAHFALTPNELAPLQTDGGPTLRATFSDAALSRDEIPVELAYQPLEDGSVRLAWQTSLNMVESPDYWNVRVDAVTGEVLEQNNSTSYDSYQVIPFPSFSDPDDSGGQALVIDPADPIASPFGWHDTDGVPGAESTLTRGNNVNAQDDIDDNDTGGFSPDGGPGLDFLPVWDPGLDPAAGANLDVSIVNLFYANNVMHDLTFQYGFDEASGNFQATNYSGMGAGGDLVEADALDGSGTNNANFSTRPEGVAGSRMQMYRWIDGGPLENGRVSENSPTVRDFVAGQGGWGGALDPGTTANTQIVDDGSGGTATHGCGALVGFTPGNIALIDRGSCEFGTKALNAETAGAVAAIIVNDQQLPNNIIAMGAGVDGGSVTIPAVMIGNADGQLIKDELALPATVNVTLQCPVGGCPVPNPIDRDSDLDNGIIAHEYGHGISIRLTGGPSNVGCLSGNEQAGEGWSDFWTLVLTAKSSDTPKLSRGVGNYTSFLPAGGPGIRNFPYTTDLGVNPQTYADIATTNVPHGVGEVWMSMLWEMYWELVIKRGLDCDFCADTGGNSETIQLVVDGMKMQNCNPTFLDARDAILAADLANNAGANECEIWRAFAKRGAGLSAVAGTTNVGDETEAFDIPATCPAIPPSIFTDGFERGDTSRWSSTTDSVGGNTALHLRRRGEFCDFFPPGSESGDASTWSDTVP